MQRLRRSFKAFLVILGISIVAAFLVRPGELVPGWTLVGGAVGLAVWLLGVLWRGIWGKVFLAILLASVAAAFLAYPGHVQPSFVVVGGILCILIWLFNKVGERTWGKIRGKIREAVFA